MDFRERAEELWEELGGGLCICQRTDVPHWCETCQRRVDRITVELRLVFGVGGILCACGHVKGRHQITNLGNITHCADCGCQRFDSRLSPEVREASPNGRMTVRQRIAEIHAAQLRGETTPVQAAQWQATLGALVGNVLKDIREAEAAYHIVYAKLLDEDGTKARAEIKAKLTPEYLAWREAKDLLTLVESMTSGLRSLTFASRIEERLSR